MTEAPEQIPTDDELGEMWHRARVQSETPFRDLDGKPLPMVDPVHCAETAMKIVGFGAREIEIVPVTINGEQQWIAHAAKECRCDASSKSPHPSPDGALDDLCDTILDSYETWIGGKKK